MLIGDIMSKRRVKKCKEGREKIRMEREKRVESDRHTSLSTHYNHT